MTKLKRHIRRLTPKHDGLHLLVSSAETSHQLWEITTHDACPWRDCLTCARAIAKEG